MGGHCVLLVELDFQPAILFSPRFCTWRREWGSRILSLKDGAQPFSSSASCLGGVGQGRACELQDREQERHAVKSRERQ